MPEKKGEGGITIDKLPTEARLVLFTVGTNDEQPIKDETVLQKILFLTTDLYNSLDDDLEYEKHLLGPYSEVVHRTADELISLRLIERHDYNYSLSNDGKKLFNKIKPDSGLKSAIQDFKAFLNDMSDDELLTFIYVFYPKYKKESIVWDKLKPKRKEMAESLYKKDKISLSKAAKMADMPVPDFILFIDDRRMVKH